MGVIGGEEEIPLSIVRLSRMEILSSEILITNESPHLTIGYLLKDEHGRLGIIISQLVALG